MAGNDLWTKLQPVCSNRELLQQVLSLLNAAEWSQMRLASRFLRNSVSQSVEKVVHKWGTGSLSTDLAMVFPAASKLSIRISQGEVNGRALTASDMFLCLQQVASSSPLFLQRLTNLAVRLHLEGGHISSNAHVAFCRLLARCTNLQGLKVGWQDPLVHGVRNTVCFEGQGSTPEQRRTSMQQQLRSICAAPTFLAPSSWPEHQCLTRLRLWYAREPQFSLMHSSATLTTSLTDLTLCAQDATQLFGCSGLSRLTRLTNLDMTADDGEPSNDRVHELAADVACLASLQWLYTNRFLLLHEQGEHRVPCGWAQLSALTCLEIQQCRLPLRSLPSLSTLRHLKLDSCTTLGSLTDLSGLSALTYIDADMSEPEGGDADVAAGDNEGAAAAAAIATHVPQAWQHRLLSLSWRYSWSDMHAISQLRSLTMLSLRGADVSPELCWHLTPLAHLRELHLPDARAPLQPTTLATPSFRAALPSLRTIKPGTCHALRALAYWTDIHPRLTLTHDAKDGAAPVVLLSADQLGAGWLSALLSSSISRSTSEAGLQGPMEGNCGGAKYYLFLALPNDGAVGRLLRALEVLGASGGHGLIRLLLGEQVGAGGVGRLLEAAHRFPQGSVRIANGKPNLTVQDLAPHAPHSSLPAQHFEHLHGVAAPALLRLRIDACGHMADHHVALIAVAAPGLRFLRLQRAAGLTDASLYALLGCRQLEDVEVTGCRQLGCQAVAVVMGGLQALRALRVGAASLEQVREVMARVPEKTGSPPLRLSDRWQLEQQVAAGRPGVRCKLVASSG